MHRDLRRIDLNLLLVFDALIRSRSVVAAASELAMSPSALSHALARLRTALSDELFVRFGNEMQPTVRAEQLANPVAEALAVLSKGFARTGRFDPGRSDRTFVISATDYIAFAVLPPFMARVQSAAPNVRFKIVYSSRKVSSEDLAAGRIDFALGYTEEPGSLPAGIEDFDLFTDDYVVIASQHHPKIRRKLSLGQYLSARHVVVTPWNETRGAIDHVLAKLALQRDVAIQLPSVLAAPFLVAHSELLMTVPRHAAQTLRGATPIAIYPTPFAVPQYTLKVYCHAKYARADTHQWIRKQFLEAAPDIGRVN